MMKTALALIVACVFAVGIAPATAAAASKTHQVSTSYEVPKDPDLKDVYEELKERRVLEKLEEFLSPFRLPRKLKIRLAGCDGEDDAFYGDDVITICYEYVDELWYNMPK